MTGVRALLTRVGRLEEARAPSLSPLERAYGSPKAFAASVQAEINAGALDPRDGPYLVMAVERWHSDRVWDVRQ